MNPNTLGLWLGRLVLLGFVALVAVEVRRYFLTALNSNVEKCAAPASRRRVLLEVLAAFIASRLLVALVCAVSYRIENGGMTGFLTTLLRKIRPWDADHYLGIIRDGYVTEGDARLSLVFFPFYPMLCRVLTFMTGMDALPAALIVSNAALMGCGCAMFRLVEWEDSAAVARRAMLLMMFCPVTYFYSIPYTESVFLLATLLAVYCARRRRFALAVLFGAMAANARVLGLAVAIPIYWEMLRATCGEDEDRAATVRRFALCAAKVLPVAAGFALYLCVNASLYGNPFQFLIYQRENWHQAFGGMANTFQYSLVNALDYHIFLYRLGVWWPQVILMLALPLLWAWRRRRERSGDMGYALVYHYVAFAPTWLLSGMRYASASYALYPMLARIPRTRRGFAALLAVECALMIFMTWVGMWRVRVY